MKTTYQYAVERKDPQTGELHIARMNQVVRPNRTVNHFPCPNRDPALKQARLEQPRAFRYLRVAVKQDLRRAVSTHKDVK